MLGLIAVSEPVLAAALAATGLLVLAAAVAPGLATVATIFILYSNVAVVAVRFHGMPKVAGQAVIGLLAVPILHALIVRRERLILHPVLPLMVLFLGVQVLGMAFSRKQGAPQSAPGQSVREGMDCLVTPKYIPSPVARWCRARADASGQS